MPSDASAGAGLPSHAKAASDLVTTAPTDARSKDPANSTPYPAVPDAVMTGERSSTEPIRAVRSTSVRSGSGPERTEVDPTRRGG